MNKQVIGFTSILILLFSVIGPCSAWVGINAKRIIVKLPETIESRFLVQIYSTGSGSTHMEAASEFQNSQSAGSDVAIPAEFGQMFYISDAGAGGSLSDEYFVRIIRSSGGSYQFKDFRTWSFQMLEGGDLILGGCRPIENTTWKPIRLSKEFTVNWVEENPGSNEDYSGNFAIISGLPKSFLSPQPLNKKEIGWRFKVTGIFYTEEGAERYYLEPIYKINGKFQSRGNSVITSGILDKNNFSLEESSYRGD